MIRILHFIGGMEMCGAETMIMNLYQAIDRNKYILIFRFIQQINVIIMKK